MDPSQLDHNIWFQIANLTLKVNPFAQILQNDSWFERMKQWERWRLTCKFFNWVVTHDNFMNQICLIRLETYSDCILNLWKRSMDYQKNPFEIMPSSWEDTTLLIATINSEKQAESDWQINFKTHCLFLSCLHYGISIHMRAFAEGLKMKQIHLENRQLAIARAREIILQNEKEIPFIEKEISLLLSQIDSTNQATNQFRKICTTAKRKRVRILK